MGHCVIFSGKQGAAPPSRIVPVRLWMDDIKVLCWFIFFPIKLRAQELFIIVLKSIKMK